MATTRSLDHLHKDGNISQPFGATLLSPLRSKKKKKNAVIQNKHVDNMEIVRSEGRFVNRCSHPHQIPLVFFLVQPVQKVVFLCRLPAGPVWSAGVPRPHGSAAAAPESGCHEQPTRNSGAKCDGLLPTDVFIPGALRQLGNHG